MVNHKVNSLVTLLLVCKKKYLSWVYGVDRKNLSLEITVRHHSASLVMPISDPRNRFFYPHHTHMKDTYNLTCVLIFGVDHARYRVSGANDLGIYRL